jgi:iron complex outermembrane receptor protein
MRRGTRRNLAWASACGVSVLMNGAAAQSNDPTESQIIQLEEVVITGSRLKSKNVEGAAPVTVLDREKIDELGVSTVTDVLRYLPQQPYTRDVLSSDAQFAQLRGLGFDMTLVLINGRRTAPSAATVGTNAFDLNSIPLAAVERIEVLSDSASAVYGADAVGGVVNIILKDSLTRPAIDLHYGTADGGSRERRISFASGYDGSRVSAVVTADWFERTALLGTERPRIADADFRRFGSIDWREPTAHPANISSVNGENLPGLTSRFAAVPAGSSGVGLTPGDFSATAGLRNMETIYRHASIVPPTERRSATASVSIEIVPGLEGFVEAIYADNESRPITYPALLQNQRVSADNPFNPFGVDVNATFMMMGLGPRVTATSSELKRGVAGVRGDVGTWDYEVSVLGTREAATTTRFNDVDRPRLAAALMATDPAQAFNVFQDGPGASPAVLDSLRAAPTTNKFASEGTFVGAFARGPLLRVPAGSISAVVGAEWQTSAALKGDGVPVDDDREAHAVYAELEVPLVSEEWAWPGVHSLTLTLAGRYDDYSDFGSTSNPKFGVMWRPVRDLLLRASYGTNFRPPSLFELYSPRSELMTQIADARRGNEVTALTAIAGGNKDLRPIKGDSSSIGFVWTPSVLPNLRISANYWDVSLDERVSILGAFQLLANEDEFPDRVTREAPTAEDLALGQPGRLSSIDISRMNFGRLDTNGIDADVAFSFETAIGRFIPSLAVTWVNEYETVDLPNLPKVDRVDRASSLGTIVQWRAVASLGWSLNGWEASVVARHTPEYADVTAGTNELNGRRVAAQTLFDMQLSYAMPSTGASWTRETKITVGARNVFDREPPFAEVGYETGYDLWQGELRQRFIYAKLSKGF